MPEKITKQINNLETKEDWGLRNIFYLKLTEIFDLENQMTKLIPRMTLKAHNSKLKSLFQSHQSETVEQLERAKRSFELFGEEIEIIPNLTARGLESETELRMGIIKGGEAIDASLVASGMSIAHYEKYCYMIGIQWAELLGETKIRQLFMQSLKEEQRMEHELFKLVIEIYSKVRDR